MYQTKKEKQDILISTLSNSNNNSSKSGSFSGFYDTIENMSFSDLDSIISRDNVIVVERPTFVFDLLTMKPVSYKNTIKETQGYSPVTHIFYEVETLMTDNLNVFDDDSKLFFFYMGTKHDNKSKLRFSSEEKKNISKAIERIEAVNRVNKFFNYNQDTQLIRDYVNSDKLVEDKLTLQADITELARELMAHKEKKSPNSTTDYSSIKTKFDAATINALTAGLENFPNMQSLPE